MAWVEQKNGRSYVTWREAKTGARRTRALGPVTPDVARAEAARTTQQEEAPRRAQSVSHRQALARFLRHLRFQRRAADTVRFYDWLLSRVFDDLAAIAAMKRWHRGHLEAALARRTSWGPRTVQMALSACRRFVRWARKSRVACPDFVEDLRGPKVEVREVDAYSPADAARIEVAARGTSIEVPVMLALLAGLSFGDLRALAWEDVTIQRGRAWIRRRRAKTGQPIEVAVAGPVVALLLRERKDSGLVCDDLPADKNNAKRSLSRVLRRAGVSHGGWHRLRHTCGALLAAAGVDLATIRRMMGHAPGSTMTLRYVHSDASRVEAAADAVYRLRSRQAKRAASAPPLLAAKRA